MSDQKLNNNSHIINDEQFVDEVIDVFYSFDKTKRYVLLRADEGYFYYIYEELMTDDEPFDEMGRPNTPYWQPQHSPRSSFFDTREIAIKELKSEPAFIEYFETNK
ncbi:MAG: hypothetical protein HDT28_02340 [Clostridiales bacterium]|nr:hypothetical protein [Clostridiales bacterium]